MFNVKRQLYRFVATPARDGLSQIVTADARRSPFSSSTPLRPSCCSPRLRVCYKLAAVRETRRIVTSLIKTEESRNDLDDISTTTSTYLLIYLPTYHRSINLPIYLPTYLLRRTMTMT